MYSIIGMIATYKVELRYWWESSELGSLVGVVNVAILFKSHCTRMMGSFCSGAPIVVNVEHFQCGSGSVVLFS